METEITSKAGAAGRTNTNGSRSNAPGPAKPATEGKAGKSGKSQACANLPPHPDPRPEPAHRCRRSAWSCCDWPDAQKARLRNGGRSTQGHCVGNEPHATARAAPRPQTSGPHQREKDESVSASGSTAQP